MPIPQYYCRPCPYPNIIVGHALQLLPLSQGGDEAADVVFSLTAEQNYYFILLQKMNFFYSEEEEVPCHPQPNKEECDMVVLATIISYTLLGLMLMKVK